MFFNILKQRVDEIEGKGCGDESSMVQVVMIAESRQLQATLNTFGIQVRKTFLVFITHLLQFFVANWNLKLIFITSTIIRHYLSIVFPVNFKTQTPSEVEPVHIWSQCEMVKVLEMLGRNEKLQLTGRPPRPLGTLGTCKVKLLIHTSDLKFILY